MRAFQRLVEGVILTPLLALLSVQSRWSRRLVRGESMLHFLRNLKDRLLIFLHLAFTVRRTESTEARRREGGARLRKVERQAHVSGPPSRGRLRGGKGGGCKGAIVSCSRPLCDACTDRARVPARGGARWGFRVGRGQHACDGGAPGPRSTFHSSPSSHPFFPLSFAVHTWH